VNAKQTCSIDSSLLYFFHEFHEFQRSFKYMWQPGQPALIASIVNGRRRMALSKSRTVFTGDIVSALAASGPNRKVAVITLHSLLTPLCAVCTAASASFRLQYARIACDAGGSHLFQADT
jgi:hypothetical protein